MWGLGGPLPRRLSNGTHPHHIPINLYYIRHAANINHEVLILLSQGYPSVYGRLDTRYSPVRRSPSNKSKLSLMLPLDLHVLSL